MPAKTCTALEPAMASSTRMGYAQVACARLWARHIGVPEVCTNMVSGWRIVGKGSAGSAALAWHVHLSAAASVADAKPIS